MQKKIKKLLQSHWPLLINLCILFALLLRNPYSNRTLIPNFEPFPDAFYYVTTPLCFLQGDGWKMCRLHNPELQGIESVVGPLYSISMLPIFTLLRDPRSFYFTNIILSTLSMFLFYLISKKAMKKNLIVAVLLLLYATNYYTYWYPTLAMAENILIPLFLLSVLLIQTKITKKNAFIAGMVVPAFYAAKYAYIPLSAVFFCIYAYKLWKNHRTRKNASYRTVLFFLLPLFGFGLLLFDIQNVLFFAQSLFKPSIKVAISENATQNPGYFSITYLSSHLARYASSLIGKPEKFLWSTLPLLPTFLALPSLLGHLLGWKKEHVLLRIYLLLAALVQLLFISTFYVVDIRYVFHFLPILLLGFGFLLSFVSKTVLKKSMVLTAISLMIFTTMYLGLNFQRLKSQVSLNLKYAETPWWQLSVVEANTYFEKTDTKPYLITLAAPFLHDYYYSNKYQLLPMHPEQDFHNFRYNVWGVSESKPLLELYAEKVKESSVFVSTYGISATSGFKAVFENIKTTFDLEEVHTGCFSTCTIYQLHEKK